MYLEHFGLDEAPFRITPHTDFFFAGAQRGATLDALVYAVLHDEGIIKLTGEVGSGKTMLCRMLMERLPASVVTVFLATPSISRDDILFAIADDLRLAVPAGARASTVLRTVQDKLIELYAAGHQVVILIDEAHTMPAQTLEEIRLLSNLESNRHKLLQLVLFGQPELDETLARPDMRQLTERITQHFSLEPLVRKDIAEYLRFRMRAAGYRGPDVFDAGAVKTVARASRGLTRRINILADKALLAAFSENTHQVTARQVRVAVRDSHYRAIAGRDWLRPLAAGGAFVAAAAATIVLLGHQSPAPAAAPQVPAAPARAIETPAAPVTSGVEKEENGQAQFGPLTRQHLAATRKWLDTAAGDHWFVQLLLTDGTSQQQVEDFLGRADKLIDPAQLHVYVADVGGAARIGVIYGDYPTQAAAVQAAARLPEALNATKPFPRQVKRLGPERT